MKTSTIDGNALKWAISACLSLALPFGWLVVKQFWRKKGEPPLLSGAIPYLGAAIAFSKNSLEFLQKMQKRYGEVFTVFLAGKRMHFVTDIHSFGKIFKSEILSFKEVAEKIGQNAFGYDVLSSNKNYDETVTKNIYLKYLQGSGYQELAERFQLALLKTLDTRIPNTSDGKTEKEGLYRWVSKTMFEAGCNSLFGSDFYEQEIFEAFLEFDEEFPLLAAQVPACLLLGKGVEKKREFLSKKLDEAIKRKRDVASIVEVQGIAASKKSPSSMSPVLFTMDDLKDMVYLESCMLEALRLASASLVIREVEKNMELEVKNGSKFKFRKGDFVTISPSLHHFDEELFGKDAEKFRGDRFVYTPEGSSTPTVRRSLEKSGKSIPITQCVMPFGGGVSMCPGRFFAMAEIKLFTAHLIMSSKLKINGDINSLKLNQARTGLGILPPKDDIAFSF